MDGWINFVESMTEGTNERMNGRIIERGDESKNATMNKYRTDVMTDQKISQTTSSILLQSSTHSYVQRLKCPF